MAYFSFIWVEHMRLCKCIAHLIKINCRDYFTNICVQFNEFTYSIFCLLLMCITQNLIPSSDQLLEVCKFRLPWWGLLEKHNCANYANLTYLMSSKSELSSTFLDLRKQCYSNYWLNWINILQNVLLVYILVFLEKTAIYSKLQSKWISIHQSLKLSFKYWHPKSRLLTGSKRPSGTIQANISLCLASFTLPHFCDWLFFEIAFKTYVCTTYLDVDK